LPIRVLRPEIPLSAGRPNRSQATEIQRILSFQGALLAM
jgi:hypothetical protein